MNHNKIPQVSPEIIQEPLAKVLAFPDGSRVVSFEQDGDVIDHPLLDENGNPSELLVYTASGSTYYFQPHEDGLSWGALLRTKPDGRTQKYPLYGNETLHVTIGNIMVMPSSGLRTTRVAGVLAPISHADSQFQVLPNDVISSANPFEAIRVAMESADTSMPPN